MNLQAKKGQVMVMAVMMISGAVLSATAAVGILMIYEIRQAAVTIDSAKAIYAADAGLECAIMTHQDDVDRGCSQDDSPTVLSNGATFKIYDVPAGKKSVGRSGSSSRAFEVRFNE